MNALASLKSQDKTARKVVYVWSDVTADMRAALRAHGADEIIDLPEHEKPWADYWEPQHFAWKLWVQHHALTHAPADACVLYCDAATVFATPPDAIWRVIDAHGVFLLDDDTQTNERWCHPTLCANMKLTAAELAGHQITAGLVGFKGGAAGEKYLTVLTTALEIARTRENIVGIKWHAYSATCMGHRHDQSILSVLTQRAGLPRQPLKDFYCDTSLRAAQQFGCPLYVHRGEFKPFEPFTHGIGEAYLINLTRRRDRLERFKVAHANIKDRVYVMPAIDGRALALDANVAHLFRNNDFHWKKAIMGCALSHRTLWEKLADDPLATSYLIMEDDVKMNERWLDSWNAAAPHIPRDADVIYLGGVLPPNKSMFPTIVDAVNPYFAHVKPNTLFSPGEPRRYFHFCNYAYVMTKTGAAKMRALIADRGIFTSGDHMIVNHGDKLLNIYFTTPLIAACYQEDDPVYQKSEFNNFSRIDGFDSDLWNNDERFSKEEVMGVLMSSIKEGSVRFEDGLSQSATAPAAPAAPTAPTAPAAPTAPTAPAAIANNLLKAVALKETDRIPTAIRELFAYWASITQTEFVKQLAWFRVFEQLIITKNSLIMAEKELVYEQIHKVFDVKNTNIWTRVLETFQQSGLTAPLQRTPGIECFTNIPEHSITAYHMKEINPQFYESSWLDTIFPQKLAYKAFDNIEQLLEVQNPLVIYQKLPNINVGELFKVFASLFESRRKQFTVLHLSDEFGNDSIEFYRSPALRAVIRNYWRPDLETYGSKVITVPLGYANNRHAQNYPASPAFADRKNIWSFVGSLDRPQRKEALDVLTLVAPNDVRTRDMWDEKMVCEAQDYNAALRNAKFVPCFRGSCALESYRLYEALEHGAIPVYLPSESAHGSRDEYASLYGKHPFLGFPSWTEAARMLPVLASKADVMERHRTQLAAWWAERKAAARAAIKSALS